MTNYRGMFNDSAIYQASLRNRVIESTGVVAGYEYPIQENNTDFYGDIIDAQIKVSEIPCLPLFDKYYQLLSILGTDIEDNLPLEVIVRTTDYIPRNAIFIIDTISQDGLLHPKRWRVLSTEVKHIDNYYSRVCHVVPERSGQ